MFFVYRKAQAEAALALSLEPALYPVAENVGYMAVLWLFMYFMYRQRIFLKV